MFNGYDSWFIITRILLSNTWRYHNISYIYIYKERERHISQPWYCSHIDIIFTLSQTNPEFPVETNLPNPLSGRVYVNLRLQDDAAPAISWFTTPLNCSYLAVSQNGNTPRSSILDWDFPWHQPSILGYHQFRTPPPIVLFSKSTRVGLRFTNFANSGAPIL